MQTEIRPYRRSDKTQCLYAFKSNVPQYFTEGEIEDFDRFLEMMGAENDETDRKKNTSYFVVVYENEIIGCGGFGDKDNTSIISLAWGLIHQSFHKKGYGEKLLSYRLEEVKKRFPESPLVIDTTQYSYGFFEKFGFRTTKITHDFYELGMHRYDMTYSYEKI